MVGQLDFQATPQGSFQHALQQPVIPAQRHLPGVDLGKNLVQRTRCLQPISHSRWRARRSARPVFSIVVIVAAVSFQLGGPLLTQKI